DDEPEIGAGMLRHALESDDLAVSVERCSALHGRGGLLPSPHEGPEGVAEGHVFPMGEQRLRWLGVPLHELAPREVGLLDDLFKSRCGQSCTSTTLVLAVRFTGRGTSARLLGLSGALAPSLALSIQGSNPFSDPTAARSDPWRMYDGRRPESRC